MDESKLEQILELESLREYKRHNIKTNGRIECVYINGQPVTLRRFPSVEIKDVSASGIRIQAGINEFVIGDRFRIRYQLGENSLTGIYEVVRTLNEKETTIEYGCRYVVDEEAKLEEERMWIRYTDTSKKMTIDSYEDILAAQEEQYGYTELLSLLQTDVETEVLAGKLRGLLEKCPETFLLNVIHHQREDEEKEVRHRLNVFLLGLMMWTWLGLSLHEESAFIDEIIQGKENSFHHAIIKTVVNYDKRASSPIGCVAGVPLSYLEQIFYEGQDKKHTGSTQKMQGVLARNVLRIIRRSDVLLKDNTIGKIRYMFQCDSSHPVLTVGSESFQLENSWDIVGLV